MEAQQAHAIQQGNANARAPWSTPAPAPSSSTPNNSALPNPWGGIPAPQMQSPFGTYENIFSTVFSTYVRDFFLSLKYCIYYHTPHTTHGH